MNRRRFLSHVAVATIAPIALSKFAFADKKSAKALPDWNKANEEVEEAKMEAAFYALKDTARFQEALKARDGETVARQIQEQTGTNYIVIVNFKEGNRKVKDYRFSINCKRDKAGQWNFRITLVTPYRF